MNITNITDISEIEKNVNSFELSYEVELGLILTALLIGSCILICLLSSLDDHCNKSLRRRTYMPRFSCSRSCENCRKYCRKKCCKKKINRKVNPTDNNIQQIHSKSIMIEPKSRVLN